MSTKNEFDISIIQKQIMEAAAKILAGDKTKKKINITIEVPPFIEDIAKSIAEASNKTVEDILGEMATQGINSVVTNATTQQTVKPTPSLPGLDMSQLMSQMGQIKELTSTLENMGQALGIDTTKTNKNNS